MSVTALFQGLAGLVILLLAVGYAGGVGSVELSIWLLLVAAWVSWWLVSRRGRNRTDP
jgi:hypothetical protein